MSQEIEFEAKTMLQEKEFIDLLQQLPFPDKPIIQTNYYFETENFALKKAAIALRIRGIEDLYTLTLKEPLTEGILETNVPLSSEKFHQWLNQKPTVEQPIYNRLAKKQLQDETLQYYGSLQTERYTIKKESVAYMLDRSSYFNYVDYELEVEATSEEKAQEAMKQLLRTRNIQKRPAKPKIARFFEQWKRQKH